MTDSALTEKLRQSVSETDFLSPSCKEEFDRWIAYCFYSNLKDEYISYIKNRNPSSTQKFQTLIEYGKYLEEKNNKKYLQIVKKSTRDAFEIICVRSRVKSHKESKGKLNKFQKLTADFIESLPKLTRTHVILYALVALTTLIATGFIDKDVILSLIGKLPVAQNP